MAGYTMIKWYRVAKPSCVVSALATSKSFHVRRSSCSIPFKITNPGCCSAAGRLKIRESLPRYKTAVLPFMRSLTPTLSQSSNYSNKSSVKKDGDEGEGGGGGEDEKSITDMVKKIHVKMESSVREVANIFTAASEGVRKALSKSHDDTEMEMQRTEKAMNSMIRKYKLRDKSVVECLRRYKADLKAIRAAYTASVSQCTETALGKLRITKRKHENAMDEVEAFDTSMKSILKNCGNDRKSLTKCLEDQKTKIQKRFDDLTQLLNRLPKDAEETTADVVKQTIECHLRAQAKAIEGFRLTLKNSARCFSAKGKEPVNNSEDTIKFIESRQGSVPDAGTKNTDQKEEICMEKARQRTKTALNMLRQNVMSCNASLISISPPEQDTITKQELLQESQAILTHLREVSRHTMETLDFLAYAKEEISSLEKRLAELHEKAIKKFSHVSQVNQKSAMFEACSKKSIETAMEKLASIDKSVNRCKPDQASNAAMSRGTTTDLGSLIQEAQQMLTSLSEMLSSTMQQGVETMRNYEELANNKIAEITNAKKRELAELSAQSEAVKSCAEKRQADFRKIEEKLKKDLEACYKKHYGSLDKILINKSVIREEAEKIKNEVQQMLTNCMSATNKTECFSAALDGLRKKLKAIVSRVSVILEEESAARVKASKAVLECDKKVTEEAYKKFTTIINDLKKCAAATRE